MRKNFYPNAKGVQKKTQRPKTTSTTTTDTASARAPTTTQTFQPPVRSVSAQDQHFTMIDNTGRNVGYMTPTAGLVMTDPSAAAPLTPQPMSAGAASPLNPHVTAFQPTLPSQGNENALRQIVDLISLPKPNLMTFSGDPLSYHMFLNAFDTCIGQADVSDAAKLNRLLELCQGKARAVIKSCALKEPTAGYQRARQLLDSRFGDAFVISEAWVRKIVDGPAIKPNNTESLQTFTDDVRDCVETLTSMKLLNEVDTRSRLVKLVGRLPTYLISRWRKKAMTDRRDTGAYPSITTFLEFLEEVCEEASDPVFGFAAFKDTKPLATSDSKSKPKQGKQSSSFAVETTVKSDDMPKDVNVKCVLCSKDHALSDCPDFKKKTPLQRLEVARDKREIGRAHV